jgi:hypothetical protein
MAGSGRRGQRAVPGPQLEAGPAQVARHRQAHDFGPEQREHAVPVPERRSVKLLPVHADPCYK